MYPSRLFLAFLSLLACFCVACGAPGVVPWPDGAVMGDARAEIAGDAPADAPAPDSPADTVAPPPDAPADAADDQAGPDVAGDGAPPLDGPGDGPADAWPDLIPVDCAETIHDDAGAWPARPGMEARLRVSVRVPTFTWTTQDAAECSITRREPPLSPTITFRAVFCAGVPAGAQCPAVTGTEETVIFRDAAGVVMDSRAPMLGVGEPYATDGMGGMMGGLRATIVSSVLTLSCGRAAQVVITGCVVR